MISTNKETDLTILLRIKKEKRRKLFFKKYFSTTLNNWTTLLIPQHILNSFLQRDIPQDVCIWSTFLYLSSKYMQMSSFPDTRASPLCPPPFLWASEMQQREEASLPVKRTGRVRGLDGCYNVSSSWKAAYDIWNERCASYFPPPSSPFLNDRTTPAFSLS